MITSSATSLSDVPPKKSIDPAILLEGFLAVGFFMLIFWPDPVASRTLAVIFSSIMLEALPFMLVGALIGGLVEVFLSRERVIALLPQKSWQTILVAGALGLIFPVCECAIVPVVKRLIGKGIPPAAAIAFLLGVPIANPLVFGSTALAYQFNWEVAGLRMGLGYLIAVGVALLIGRLYRKSSPLLSSDAIPESHCSCGCSHEQEQPALATTEHEAHCACGCCSPAHEHDHAHITSDKAKQERQSIVSRLAQALRHAIDDLMGVGHYLVIGAFVAALAQTFISRSTFAEFSGNPILPVFVMIALAFLLNLCSEADAFIAASFQGLVPLPAQMAFMLTGPVLDLKLLLMYQSIFKKRAILVLATTIFLAISAVSVLLTLFWKA